MDESMRRIRAGRRLFQTLQTLQAANDDEACMEAIGMELAEHGNEAVFAIVSALKLSVFMNDHLSRLLWPDESLRDDFRRTWFLAMERGEV